MEGNAIRKDAGREEVVAVVPTMKGEPPVLAEEEELGREVSTIELEAEGIVIENDADYEAAGEFGKLLKTKAGEVTDFFKPLKDAAYRAHKAVCDREKEMLTPLRNAESVVKKTMGDYFQEQERKRREAEAAAQRALEMETQRQIDEAARLESEGRDEEAAAALAGAEVLENAGRMAVVSGGAPKAKGVSVGKEWEVVSVNDKEVPLAINGAVLRPVDMAAVMRLIRASKGAITIPGITYREVPKVSFGRKKA